MDYYFAVRGCFAFGAVCMTEPYEEVAHVVAVVYGYHFLRQLQPILCLDLLQNLPDVDV